MEKLLDKLNQIWVDFGINLIYVIVIYFVGSRLIRFFLKKLKNGKLLSKIDKTISTFMLSFINITAYIVLIIIIAGVIGIPQTSIITLLGSAGIAVGLALQGGLSNIAGGLIILAFKPFRVGDFIDNHTDMGTVKGISLFYTTICTVDNRIISIPNGALANTAVVNFSTKEKRRLDVNVSVSYDNDVELVKKTLNEIIKKDERILKDEDIFVRLTDYQDSAMIYTIRVWTKKDDIFPVKFDLLENIKKEFDKKKITIPYNQLDVHLDK